MKSADYARSQYTGMGKIMGSILLVNLPADRIDSEFEDAQSCTC